ncbi:Mobile element protein [Hyphomicrobiales bacterium]|nr:Mobile element protein [Hyphomicrobiales bacterium]
MMNTVYNLWYTREYEDREDTLLHIGIYVTAKDCEEVIEKLSDKPGFRDYPEGFSFEAVTLGSTGWQEGFVTVYYPAKEREAEDFPAIPEAHKS